MTLFRLPPDVRGLHATLKICGTGDLTSNNHTSCRIFGLGPEPVTVYEQDSRDAFLIDETVEAWLHEEQGGELVTCRVDTFKPGAKNSLSDFVFTLLLQDAASVARSAV